MDSSRTCNKCRSGARQAGDSWCIGCSSLESIAADLKRGWNSGALRVIAEDACVAAARAVRALRFAGNRLEDNLPRAEKSPAAEEEWSLEEVEEEPADDRDRGAAHSTAAKSRAKRARSPEVAVRPRPKTPPRPPPGHRERERAERQELEQAEDEAARVKKRKHRGGTKHQQHTRQRDDGHQRVTHRPLGREHYERRAPPRANEER